MRKLTMTTLGFAAALLSAATILVACSKATQSPTDVAAEPPSPAPAEEEPPATPPPSDAVEVAAEGTRFDPPIAPSKVPDGAWMCEMGNAVHYASLAQGNGECPVCGMSLKQKTAGEEDHEDGADHAGHKH